MPNLQHVSPVMSQSATQEGLKQNPFRIFGLRVDLTSKELTEAIKDLSIQMELGAELTHAFALGAVDASVLAQANQRLRDPVQRLCDECFWFWPMDMGQQDVALDLIANGDKAGAKEAWREFLGHPEWGPIASHNLAILHLYESFEDSMDLEKYGINAADFLGSEVCTGRIKARIRTLDDPRLPRNSAPAVLEELRHAMAVYQVRVGFDRIQDADSVRGHRNIRCARNIAGGEDALGSVVCDFLEDDFRRLENKGAISAESATEPEWKSLAEETLRVIALLQPFPSLANRVEIIGNNAARKLRSISIHTYNEKKQRKKALEIAELAHKLAYGDILKKVNEDISTVKEGIEDEASESSFGPIMDRLKAMDASYESRWLTSEGRSVLAALNSAVDAGQPKERAAKIYQNLGWLIRSKAIHANNTHREPGTARVLIFLALEVVTHSESRGLHQEELKLKLEEDCVALGITREQLRKSREAQSQSNASSRSSSSYSSSQTTAVPKGSCLIPIVAILCLSGATGYAAPAAIQSVNHLIKTLLS
jgi:hypothetical protein